MKLNLTTLKEEMLNTKAVNRVASGIKRSLIVTPIRNGNGRIGTVVISIEGTPPKGYAVYIVDNHTITILDWSFRKVKTLTDVEMDVPESEVIYEK